MTRVRRRDSAASIASAFGLERAAAADRSRVVQQSQAVRTVAGHALDVGDCRELLSMLGLNAAEAGDGATRVPTTATERHRGPRALTDRSAR